MSVEEYLLKINKLKDYDAEDINRIIDQLNILSTVDLSEKSEVIGELLLQLAKRIPSKNDHLLSKFCSLLCYIFDKQKEKIRFCPSTLEYLTQFMICNLNSCGAWVLNDIFIAFTAFLNCTDQGKLQQVNSLFTEDSILLSSLESKEKDKNIQYNALQCLFSLLKNLGEAALSVKILDLCCQKCLLVLKDINPYNDVDILSLKILVCCLKNLQLIFSSKNAEIKNVGEVLGVLKNLMFYGLPGQSFAFDFDLIPSLQNLEVSHFLESQSESDASHPKLRKQKKNRRKVKKSQKSQPVMKSNYKDVPENSDGCSSSNGLMPFTSFSRSFKDIKIKSSSSDSEFSDVDNQTMKNKTVAISIRQNAYQTLQTVVKLVDRKTMFGYWSSFLPDYPIMSAVPASQTIFSTILKDPAPQVRHSALTLLVEILRGSKQYLSLADGRSTKRTAFTSLSSILTSIIREIHRCLLLALLAENSVVLLVQILKCYAVLAENVPYNKFNNDILFKYLKHIKGFIDHKDTQVQVATLNVFTSLVNSDQIPDDFENLVLSTDFDFALDSISTKSSTTSLSDEKDEQLPWIIEVCRNKIHSEDHLSVRIQSLQLLSSLTGKYFHKSEIFLPVIDRAVLHCLNDSDSSIQLHGIKLLDITGRCLNELPEVPNNVKLFVSDLFFEAVTGPLTKCITDKEHKALQAAACDSLSTLPSTVFALLSPKQQILYLSVLLGLASDSNVTVRGAAIRCLGIFCLFDGLFQDAQFFDDLCLILKKSVHDSNVNVRFKASWALGNLSDALFLSRNATSFMNVQFFCSASKLCIEYSKDCDRVKANAVRALGNFLLFLPEQYLSSPSIQGFCQDACKTLINSLSAGFMKVCWNACYAMSSMLKNEVIIKNNIVNVQEVLGALVKGLKSPNFKVRISAVQALSSLRSRDQYGETFPLLWKQILVSLQSSYEDVNFKEIKHQKNLCNQLCYSLCQFTLILTEEDLIEIEKETILAKETLLTSMWQFGTLLTEEKYFTVSAAVKHVTSLKDKNHELILTMLQDVLNQAVMAYHQHNPCKNI